MLQHIIFGLTSFNQDQYFCDFIHVVSVVCFLLLLGIICLFITELEEFLLSFLGGSDSKESTCNAGDCIRSLDWEDPLEKETATHFSILAWRIPCRVGWWATVHGAAESDTAEQLTHTREFWILLLFQIHASKYFLQFVVCLFFWRIVYVGKQNFSFCWSLIYHISAMVCIFYDQKNFYILQSYNVSSMFSSKYFIILTFKFRSVIYFKLVFIYDVQFIFSKWICSFSSTNFWK